MPKCLHSFFTQYIFNIIIFPEYSLKFILYINKIQLFVLCSLFHEGGDDRRVLLWNVEKAMSDIGEPAVMKGEHNSNIFCLALNSTNTKLYSGGDLFSKIMNKIIIGCIAVHIHTLTLHPPVSNKNV